MADGVDDMTGAEAARGREGKFSRAARDALEVHAPSADELSRAVAATLARQAAMPPPQENPLGEIVRASVRCGTESRTQHSSEGSRVITSYKKVRFKSGETADGREHEIEHGRPVALKREAFLHYAAQGLVIRAD